MLTALILSYDHAVRGLDLSITESIEESKIEILDYFHYEIGSTLCTELCIFQDSQRKADALREYLATKHGVKSARLIRLEGTQY